MIFGFEENTHFWCQGEEDCRLCRGGRFFILMKYEGDIKRHLGLESVPFHISYIFLFLLFFSLFLFCF